MEALWFGSWVSSKDPPLARITTRHGRVEDPGARVEIFKTRNRGP